LEYALSPNHIAKKNSSDGFPTGGPDGFRVNRFLGADREEYLTGGGDFCDATG
jgi:hypothetical protein